MMLLTMKIARHRGLKLGGHCVFLGGSLRLNNFLTQRPRRYRRGPHEKREFIKNMKAIAVKPGIANSVHLVDMANRIFLSILPVLHIFSKRLNFSRSY